MAHMYPIGTTYTAYTTHGKHPRICTVVDQLTTLNSKGDIVAERYVSVHEFLGQQIADRDVVAVTIARGLISTPPI